MIHILIVFGTLLFIEALFDKWGFWDRLDLTAAKIKIRFLYDLFTCMLCIRFHLSWILTIIYGAFAGYGWHLLIVPVVVSGLLTLKR